MKKATAHKLFLLCTATLVCLLLVTLTSCSDRKVENEKFGSDARLDTHRTLNQELVRGGGSEPHSLDPQIGYGTEMFILRDLHEGLVESGPDGSTKPAVAERWESDDNRVYRFYLRKNAKWSNGDPVTAGDFVFSWRRLVSPATGSSFAWYLEAAGVENADDIVAGKKQPETLGVKALDDYTLEVTLDRPLTYFVDMLVHASTYPLHPPTVNRYGSNWPKLGTHIGNGPFLLSDWVVNEKILLDRNPLYWDSKSVRLQRVTYLPISDVQVEIARYLAGELDVNYQLSGSQIEQLKKTIPSEVYIAPMLGTGTIAFNTTSPPLDDPRLRKALSLALDRELIVDRVTGQGEKPSYTLTPLDTAGIEDPQFTWVEWPQEKREEEARKLYSAAGYSTSKPLKLRLLHPSGRKKLPLTIAAMWKQVLGLEVTLENNEFSIYLQNLEKGDFQTTSLGWIGDYFEPSTMLNLLRGDTGTNYTGFSNPKYDQTLNEAASESNPDTRAVLYAEAERLLAAETPIIPLHQFTNARLVKPYVQGYTDHPLMLLPSKNLWISENQ